jgi:hypothetical protein
MGKRRIARRAIDRRRRAAAVVLAAAVLGPVLNGGPLAEAAPSAPVRPASPPEGSIPDLAAQGWQPVLDENFNGATLDESVWTIGKFDWDGIHNRETVDVVDGNLQLTTFTDADGRHRAAEVRSGGLGTQSPSEDGFRAAFGYMEARMRFPDGPYTGSTFWTMSQNGNNSVPFGDPAADSPELDIVEHGNKAVDDESDGDDSDGDVNDDGNCDWPTHLLVPCSETLLSGGHWDGFEEDHKVNHTTAVKNPSYDPANAAATSLQGNFHTYGMSWTPTGYTFYVDGIETYRVATGTSYTPQHLILATYVYRPDAGFPAGFTYGHKGAATNDVTLVDYVRVWQRPVSEIPDVDAVAGRPVALPFTVADHFSSSTARAEPGSVRVTATSSDQSVVADSGITVTGNGPADPDGSFQNGTFEAGTSGWTFPALAGGGTNNATVWSTRSHTPGNALRLSEVNNSNQAGRAEQVITGLQPDTTYVLSGRYDLEIGFTDTNGNGRIDTGEPFTEPGETETDGTAAVDWGIEDVDASRSGNQPVTVRISRNGYTEGRAASWWTPDVWREEQLKFTTGPATSAVTLFIANDAYKTVQEDSDVTIDSLTLRPLIPAQRTVAVVPSSDADGSATITLTATDAANAVMGTEAFTVTFRRGSTLTNGGFEQSHLGGGWALADGDLNGRGADVIHENPFVPDRALELARPAGTAADGWPVPAASIGTASQAVSGLAPGVPYTLSVSGRSTGGDLVVAVQGHTGPGSQITETIATPTWSTKTLSFTPTATTATVLLLDWNGSNGSSLVDDVSLVPTGAVGAVATSWPNLGDVQEQHVPSSAPAVVPFNVATTAGSTVTATSDNPEVLPTANVTVASAASGGNRVLALQPLHDRTGRATVTVSYTDTSGPHTKDIAVVVSDGRLLNPDFEQGAAAWGLPPTASHDGASARTGSGGLQVNATSANPQPATQTIGVPTTTRTECIATWTIGAWATGSAKLVVRRASGGAALAEATWDNPGSWTEKKVAFTSAGCFETTVGAKGLTLELSDTNTGDGVAARFDDVYLVHAPAIRTIRDLSIPVTQTSYGWSGNRSLSVGRVPATSYWNPAVSSVTSSDPSVLPPGNVRFRPEGPNSGWPYQWEVQTRAGTTTGRSNVTVTLADPFNGSNSRTFALTVNAGSNLNNGDFERSLDGWVHSWLNDSWDRRVVRRETLPNPPSTSYDGVLRISSGIVGYRVRDLVPGTEYVLQATARGSGSNVVVKANDNAGCVDDDLDVPDSPENPAGAACVQWMSSSLGSVTIDSSTWAATPNLMFTPDPDDSTTIGDESDVWIFVRDPSPGTVPPSQEPCRTDIALANEETCIDDIGVFVASDVGL